MKSLLILMVWVLLSFGSDTLFAVSPDTLPEIGSSVAYLNQQGDTLVPFGKYLYYSSDTIDTYGFVLSESTIMAIDSRGEELYAPFIYDNGPDYISEGLFRIVQDSVIGYADAVTGAVVIAPQFLCAKPFRGSRARVAYDCHTVRSGDHWTWKSKAWFLIDTMGQKVE